MLKPSEIKVSFDFDGTLERESIQRYAKELVERGHEVWIVTSRFGDEERYKTFFMTTTPVGLTNADLFDIAAKLGIPRERVHFTDMDDKWPFFKFIMRCCGISMMIGLKTEIYLKILKQKLLIL
jgi:hypothetical protein